MSSLLRAFVGQMFIIPSQSMENTLLIGDRVAVQKITKFDRGDVVVFTDPGQWLDESIEEPGPFDKALEFIGLPTKSTPGHLIKRVIGMPGDKVVCCDSHNRITVNGKALDETSYLYSGPDGQVNPSDVRFQVVVPKDRIFVMGDHRSLSADSRCHLSDLSDTQGKGQVAFVPIKLVVGPAFAIVGAVQPGDPTAPPGDFRRRPGAGPTCPRRSGDLPGRGELLMSVGATSAVLVKRTSGIYGYERALKRAGFDPVAGADEAGRGACAGPLVAAAAILSDAKSRQIEGLKDSKLLTALQRERLYAEITRKAVAWSVVGIEPGECDALGMHVANVMALRMALLRLEVAPTYVLTDGFPVDGLGAPGLAVWKGDRVAACVAAASIIAKVTRDRIMASWTRPTRSTSSRSTRATARRCIRRGSTRTDPRPPTGCGSSTFAERLGSQI